MDKNIPKGQLKIFFGYASNVGKTVAMLQAAQQAKQQGIDVVVGCVHFHDEKSRELLKGLECLYVKENELELDLLIERHPQLAIIDELAYTNPNGSRHNKRYQDIQELLNEGIHVYTTINVQSIESLNDKIYAITQIENPERIPDSIFDQAQYVELIDIEVIDLLKRYPTCPYTQEQLTTLRELALRRCVERLNRLEEYERVKSLQYIAQEHVLVCLSSAPSNAKIIRTAARMAHAFKGSFTALYVETKQYKYMNDEDKNRLRENIRLAQQLGANIEWVCGEDVPFQIAEYARLSKVSKIVIGRTHATKKIFRKAALIEELITHDPNLDIHIIPDNINNNYVSLNKHKFMKLTLKDLFICGITLIVATLIGYLFSHLGFSEANIIPVYILAVLIISLATTHQAYALIASIVSVLIFNFFFTDPHFTLKAYEQGYPVTFLIMFIVSFMTGSLAHRLKEHSRKASEAAYHTKVLFDTSQLLQQAQNKQEIIQACASQLMKILNRNLLFYLNGAEEPIIFDQKGPIEEKYFSEKEKNVAAWVLKNNKHAGATTDTLSDASCLYLAIRTPNQVYGVVGIVMDQKPLEALENSILLSVLNECALALENEKNAREKEEAAILAKNEQLRANLLRAISHDLRTPLTSISGNASNLLSNGEKFDTITKNQIYQDIYDDSMWLINLVENLLSVTRIEEGRVQIQMHAELMEEVISEALRHVSKSHHEIKTYYSEEFILAKIDAKLIVQVMINLIDNAIKYTPENTTIEIHCIKLKDEVLVQVKDEGAGIADEVKPRIFDMFYSGANQIADSRRSMGLGLSLCKLIIQMHGKEIQVLDNIPHGSIFSFTLPTEEVQLYE